MKLLVTGASGFLGRHVVAETLRRGHEVRAMVRPAADVSCLGWPSGPALDIVRADLRSMQGLAGALDGVEAVVHLAAQKQGDFHEQLATTVLGTENLLHAMTMTGVRRLVAVSTMSVYDHLRLRGFARLDESSPIEADPERRETYARSKLPQEQLVRGYADTHGLALTILRPGFIYGPDNLWTDLLGLRLGSRCWLRFAVPTRLPITYVENCAEAVARCVEDEAAVGQVFNVVDEEAPTRARYARELCRRMQRAPVVIPVPGFAIRGAARLAEWVGRLVFRGRVKLPWLLVPAQLHVQAKPLRFSSRRIRETIGWVPRYSFTEAIDRSCAHA